MWRNRYNDLWLYPMPDWFVRISNRTIGPYVLDLIVVSEVFGLGLALVGNSRTGTVWMRIVGYVLLTLGILLIVMMIITAQYRLWKHRNRPPDSGTNTEKPRTGTNRPGIRRSGKNRRASRDA